MSVTNDLADIAKLYFKPKIFYINTSNFDWNFKYLPKILDKKKFSNIFIELTIEQKNIINKIVGHNYDLICKVPFDKLNRDVCTHIKGFSLNLDNLYPLFYKSWIEDYSKLINNYIYEINLNKAWDKAQSALDDLHTFYIIICNIKLN